MKQRTRTVLSPGNRTKPCKFRYVKPVVKFIWKIIAIEREKVIFVTWWDVPGGF